MKRILCWKTFKFFLIALFLYGCVVAFPLLNTIPRFVFGTHLILFTNEFEARPCGGFLTAFGTFSLVPFHYELKNAYHFEKNDFGVAPEPLDKVSPTLKFWDLGTSSDLEVCTQKFKSAYNTISQKEVKHVVLLNIGSIEKIFSFLGDFEIEGQLVNGETFFSFLSKSAADVDRHDETSLKNRKSAAVTAGKQMIKRLVFRPWVLPKTSFFVKEQIKNGAIYVHGVSPEISPQKTDFAMIEWNLGGGKSSRFLKKKIALEAREITPDNWHINATFTAKHLGGENEPISQKWNGVFELRFPSFLEQSPVLVETAIFPGESFEKSFQFDFAGSLEAETFSLFRPRGQQLFADVAVAMFPEKRFQTANFENHENVGFFVGEVSLFRKIFDWNSVGDKASPFVTLHEFVGKDHVPETHQLLFQESARLVEVHFNEKVTLDDRFEVSLVDRDFTHKDITENPTFIVSKLLPDQKTLLLGFAQETTQKEERFYLQMSGVRDLFGNEIVPTKRTVIER